MILSLLFFCFVVLPEIKTLRLRTHGDHQIPLSWTTCFVFYLLEPDVSKELREHEKCSGISFPCTDLDSVEYTLRKDQCESP